jgi:hypothetical protein
LLNLWITNEEGTLSYVKESLKNGQELQDILLEIITQTQNKEGMLQDIINAYLSRVSFEDIKKGLLEE